MSPYQNRVIRIVGNGNVVANNVIDAANAIDLHEGFAVEGDYNVIRDNTVLIGKEWPDPLARSAARRTRSTATSRRHPSPTARAVVGMEFTADGNYYGDNRMAAKCRSRLAARCKPTGAATSGTERGGRGPLRSGHPPVHTRGP